MFKIIHNDIQSLRTNNLKLLFDHILENLICSTIWNQVSLFEGGPCRKCIWLSKDIACSHYSSEWKLQITILFFWTFPISSRPIGHDLSYQSCFWDTWRSNLFIFWRFGQFWAFFLFIDFNSNFNQKIDKMWQLWHPHF